MVKHNNMFNLLLMDINSVVVIAEQCRRIQNCCASNGGPSALHGTINAFIMAIVGKNTVDCAETMVDVCMIADVL